MNSAKSDKNADSQVKSSQWLNKVMMQAVSLANDAAQSEMGKQITRQVNQIVDEAGPQVMNAVKTYTADVSNPYEIGMGLEVMAVSDERIECTIPHRWRNRNSNGSVHSSALFSLAEFTSRTFVQKRFSELQPRLTLTHIQGKFFDESYRRVRAKMEMAGETVEEKMAELNSAGKATISTNVFLKKKGDANVAEFSVEWSVQTDVRVKDAETEVIN